MLLYSLVFLKSKSFLYVFFFRKQKKTASCDSFPKYLDSVFSAIFPLIFLFLLTENSREIQSFAPYWAEKHQTGKFTCVSVFGSKYSAKKAVF